MFDFLAHRRMCGFGVRQMTYSPPQETKTPEAFFTSDVLDWALVAGLLANAPICACLWILRAEGYRCTPLNESEKRLYRLETLILQL